MAVTSADQLERRALASKTTPKVTVGSRTPQQQAAYQRILEQQRAENQARLAGTQRQADIAYGLRPLDVGATRAALPSTPRATTTAPAPMNTAFLSTALAGGMGGAGATTPKNVAELRAMYAKALAELQRQQGVSGETIAGSIGRMKADPYNTANAYAALRGVAPIVAGNPVAEYAAATGVSPTGAAEAQRLAEAEAQQYQAATQNIADIMRTSQEVANQSRMADIGLIETGSQQDLANQANMLNLLLKQSEIGAVSGLQQRNLENEIAMRNALTGQIANIFSGQDVAPESILKLVEATMAKLNMSRWA